MQNVYRYDIELDRWEKMPPMIKGRAKHASCAIGSTLYVFCGKVDKKSYQKGSIEKLAMADAADSINGYN